MKERIEVGAVKAGERFFIYDVEYLKIDGDKGRASLLCFSINKGEPHGNAVHLTTGVVDKFPTETLCEVERE